MQCMKGIIPNPSTESMSYKLLQMLLKEDMDVDAISSRFARMRAQTHTAEASLSEEMSKVVPTEDKRGG